MWVRLTPATTASLSGIRQMDFAEVVRKQRMVRHFTGEAVSREAIERIVGYAPRTQRWFQPGW